MKFHSQMTRERNTSDRLLLASFATVLLLLPGCGSEKTSTDGGLPEPVISVDLQTLEIERDALGKSWTRVENKGVSNTESQKDSPPKFDPVQSFSAMFVNSETKSIATITISKFDTTAKSAGFFQLFYDRLGERNDNSYARATDYGFPSYRGNRNKQWDEIVVRAGNLILSCAQLKGSESIRPLLERGLEKVGATPSKKREF